MAERRSTATVGRRAEVDRVVAAAVRWLAAVPAVDAVALCGSWAAGRATSASDVDLLVVTGDRGSLIADRAVAMRAFGPATSFVRRQPWGPHLTELRFRMPSGLEVELGVADRAWVATEPVDPGTARVVSDGFIVLHDPGDVLHRLVAAVGRARDQRRT